MKFSSRLVVFAPLIVGMLALMAFSLKTDPSSDRGSRILAYYLDGIDRLDSSVVILLRTVESSEALRPSVLQLRFRTARREYKRIEFLVEYFDRYAAVKLNGVPLRKVVAGDPLRSVIEPEGFQVIEELVYGEQPASSREEIASHLRQMRQSIARLRQSAASIALLDRYLLEAMRDQMVRIMTQTIAGFDSPAAPASIEDAAISLDGVFSIASIYTATLDDRLLAARIDRRFLAAVRHLKDNPDFESFDRVAFIREHGDPLYSILLDLHLAMRTEFPSEASPFNRAINYTSRSIFDRDFLNPYFFSHDRFDRPSAERADLGMTLFFDPVLSGDNSRSCASCHLPNQAFSDGVPRSPGFHGQGTVARNSPSLLNSVFSNGLFHDSRAQFFEDQVEQVLLNGNEMRSTFEALVPKLKKSPVYAEMFRRAFAGTSDTIITHNGIKQALGSYMRTLVALDSPFDRYMRGDATEIDPAARRGFNLFLGKGGCGTCHFAPIFNGTVPPLFTDTEIEVLGTTTEGDLKHPRLDGDPGRFAITLDENVRNGFKTPTVRNAGLTAPYMHNGAFTTIEQVIEFYDLGGGAGLGLSVPNQTLPSDRLELSEREKKDLIAFIRSLSDTSGTRAMPLRLPRFPNDPEIDRRSISIAR